jgi:hypothetical protein
VHDAEKTYPARDAGVEFLLTYLSYGIGAPATIVIGTDIGGGKRGRSRRPATKEAIRQIDSTMLLTMSPILLALIFVALLMPWLTKLKLPGGVEAELAQPKEQISRSPSGPVTLNLGSSGSGH